MMSEALFLLSGLLCWLRGSLSSVALCPVLSERGDSVFSSPS